MGFPDFMLRGQMCPQEIVSYTEGMEESVVAGGGADLVYALQQKLADPSICVKSNHDDPLELKNVCPADAVASLE